MNNKYSVACITLVRDKYKINTDRICVVYMADLIRKFDSKSNRTANSIRFEIRFKRRKTIRRSLNWSESLKVVFCKAARTTAIKLK